MPSMVLSLLYYHGLTLSQAATSLLESHQLPFSPERQVAHWQAHSSSLETAAASPKVHVTYWWAPSPPFSMISHTSGHLTHEQPHVSGYVPRQFQIHVPRQLWTGAQEATYSTQLSITILAAEQTVPTRPNNTHTSSLMCLDAPSGQLWTCAQVTYSRHHYSHSRTNSLIMPHT